MKKKLVSFLLSLSIFIHGSLPVMSAASLTKDGEIDVKTTLIEQEITESFAESGEDSTEALKTAGAFAEPVEKDTETLEATGFFTESREENTETLKAADSLAESVEEDTAALETTESFAESEVTSTEVQLLEKDATDNKELAKETPLSLLSPARQALSELLAEKTISALIYLCDYYDLKESADNLSESLVSLPSGQLVILEDVELDSSLEVWYRVSCLLDNQTYTGYIQKKNLAYSDEDFLAWEQKYPLSSFDSIQNLRYTMEDVYQFPSSYRGALTILKNAHPNWVFVRMNTNLNWDYVVENEAYQDRSMVPSTSPASWKKADSGQPNWSIASHEIIRYYLDPRNFLKDPYIFQFEQLTYNRSYHTQNAVQQLLSSTFMKGQLPDNSITYAKAFYDIGRSKGVSPFHLACRVYQEQGRGTSPLISGTYPGYEGLYNYFNVGAAGDTEAQVIQNGLAYARSKGWTSRYASLAGGASILSQNYILEGQDTLYLQKFDVDNSANGLFWHQYMQNLSAPSSESIGIRNAYNSAGALDNAFVFKIPVYNNMPETACPLPAEATSNYVFSDIQVVPGNWKYESVNYVYEKRLMMGISGTTLFKPDDSLTRSMFATILHRAAGTPHVTFSNRFTDVPAGQWYSNAIIWAQHQGIVSGYNDGSGRFGINDPITREQIARMLYEYAAKRGYNVSQRHPLDPFVDQASISSWGRDYLSWAVGASIVTGKPNADGSCSLDPKGYATRAECAAMIMRFLKTYG
ncbi:MAG: S-layer homology domain-containing protein [Lachnospiraceae bacterium]|nr:S-layer homology domain-containing protein [Lachnospiraceae bacterium]